MQLKLVLLAAHLGFAIATPASTGLTNGDSLQARDAPQAAGDSGTSYDDGHASKYDESNKDEKPNAYPPGQDSYNPGIIEQKQEQRTDSGPSDTPQDVRKQWSRRDSGNYNSQDKSQYDGDHKGQYDGYHKDQYDGYHKDQYSGKNQYDGERKDQYNGVHKDQYDGDHKDQYRNSYGKGQYDSKGSYDQYDKSYGQPHKDDHSGDWSAKQYGQDSYRPKGYDGYSNHGDKEKGYAPKYDQDWARPKDDSYSSKGNDNYHCPDRSHAVPFHRPNDDHDIIGYFFEHEEHQTFNLFAIHNEHTDDYFYTIDLAEKIIYQKQFGFEKDLGIIGYIFHDYGCGGVALYRVFDRHNHKYYFTTSEEKRHEKLGAGWEDGGITGYIYKA